MAVAAAGWVLESPGDYAAFKFPPSSRHDPIIQQGPEGLSALGHQQDNQDNCLQSDDQPEICPKRLLPGLVAEEQLTANRPDASSKKCKGQKRALGDAPALPHGATLVPGEGGETRDIQEGSRSRDLKDGV